MEKDVKEMEGAIEIVDDLPGRGWEETRAQDPRLEMVFATRQSAFTVRVPELERSRKPELSVRVCGVEMSSVVYRVFREDVRLPAQFDEVYGDEQVVDLLGRLRVSQDDATLRDAKVCEFVEDHIVRVDPLLAYAVFQKEASRYAVWILASIKHRVFGNVMEQGWAIFRFKMQGQV